MTERQAKALAALVSDWEQSLPDMKDACLFHEADVLETCISRVKAILESPTNEA